MLQKFELLAEPLQIGRVQAKNRIWLAPLWTRYASVDGEVTQSLIDHYVARAKAGVGLVMQEGTAVDCRHAWRALLISKLGRYQSTIIACFSLNPPPKILVYRNLLIYYFIPLTNSFIELVALTGLSTFA